MLDLLKEYRANFNLQDWEGNTVFHELVTYSRQTDSEEEFTPAGIAKTESYIKRLLQHGSKLELPNRKGLSPLEIPDYGNKEMIQMKRILRRFI